MFGVSQQGTVCWRNFRRAAEVLDPLKRASLYTAPLSICCVVFVFLVYPARGLHPNFSIVCTHLLFRQWP